MPISMSLPSSAPTSPSADRPRRRYAPRMPPGQRREQLIDAALQVIPTPGHTPGHCAFYFEAHRALFVGDAMCAWSPMTGRRGPQLMPRPFNESNQTALQSLDALEPIDADIMLFGHGDPWTSGVGAAVGQARAQAG